MMQFLELFLLIIGALGIVSGAIIAIAVLIRKLPTVSLIDVKNIPVDRSARMKEQIIADRIVRSVVKKSAPARRLASRGWNALRGKFRKAARAAFELERKGEIRAREGWDALTAMSRLRLLTREGDKLAKEERYGEAEQKYLRALAIDMKNPKTYEKLGNLYLRSKNYEQARETLRYASRLSPNDASVVASLGELAYAQGQYEDAVTYFQHAVSIRPRSPRYLDFLLESCIIGGNRTCAVEAFERLAGVNPENAKLPDFHERIRLMGE